MGKVLLKTVTDRPVLVAKLSDMSDKIFSKLDSMTWDEKLEKSILTETAISLLLGSPSATTAVLPGAELAAKAAKLSKDLGLALKLQHDATQAISKVSSAVRNSVPSMADAIVDGVGIVGGVKKYGKETLERAVDIVKKNPLITKTEKSVVKAVEKVAGIEKKIEEKKLIFKLLEESQPGPGGSKGFQRYVNLYEDGIQVLFRNDTGVRAHEMPKHFPGGGKISHYNIEIKKITRVLKNGDIKTQKLYHRNFHIVVDENSNVIKTFWS